MQLGHSAQWQSLQPLQTPLLNHQQQQQHMQQRRQLWSPLPPAQAASGSNPQQQGPGWFSWFDRLPAQTQLFVMGGLLFFGLIVVPFLQPTFLYGDGSMGGAKPGSGQITEVQEAPVKYELPRYIPVASELYSFLQDNSMPRTLPDGRSESPGVLRIYMSSMVILVVFYMCSAVVSVILRGVAGILRAAGVMGPAKPTKPEEP